MSTQREWFRDTETNQHFLSVDGDASWLVYKTPAGDYALTLHSDAEGHGDDVDYFDKLRQAKREAEKRATY